MTLEKRVDKWKIYKPQVYKNEEELGVINLVRTQNFPNN